MENLSIRNASKEEVRDFFMENAKAEGWNPGLFDYEAFHEADPFGFFIGYLDTEPVGCISLVRYPNGYSFLGLYIVLPDHRDKGFGLQLWQAAISYAKEDNIGLDGVVAQQEAYKKSGFSYFHENIRFSGTLNPGTWSSKAWTDHSKVLAATSLDFSELLHYDAAHFSAPRSAFLKAWIRLYPSFVFCENGEIEGFVTVRPCAVGHKIGPLYAKNTQIALTLLHKVSQITKDDLVFLDIIGENREARMLAETMGFAPVFQTARMYTKGKPQANWQEVLGITTFELG